MTKVRGVGGQVEQMKQLTAQLKKNKDSAMQKINGLEKRIADAASKIQVRKCQFACFLSTVMLFCNVDSLLPLLRRLCSCLGLFLKIVMDEFL